MKIVEDPINQNTTFRIRCHNFHCKALIELKKSEMREVFDQRDGDAYVMTCPACKHETWINASSIAAYEYK